jgi:hypothetical protein
MDAGLPWKRGQDDGQVELDWKRNRIYRDDLQMRCAGCRDARAHEAVFFALNAFLL